MDIAKRDSGALVAVIDAVGTSGFWPSLHAYSADLVPHEMGAAFIYVGGDPPIRLYDSEASAERDRIYAMQVRGCYLISPYYNGLVRRRAAGGFYHIDDLAPDDFHESEYYRVYFSHKGVGDEGMFFSPIDDDTTIAMMVERHKGLPPFSRREIDVLREAASTVNALIRCHARVSGRAGTAAPDKGKSRSVFRDVAERFGADILSRRERDVVMLVLRGHSSKSAARELGISPETERVHRRNIYSRLGISSHLALFWLFVEAADYYDPARMNDPLFDYFLEKNPDLLCSESNTLPFPA